MSSFEHGNEENPFRNPSVSMIESPTVPLGKIIFRLQKHLTHVLQQSGQWHFLQHLNVFIGSTRDRCPQAQPLPIIQIQGPLLGHRHNQQTFPTPSALPTVRVILSIHLMAPFIDRLHAPRHPPDFRRSLHANCLPRRSSLISVLFLR